MLTNEPATNLKSWHNFRTNCTDKYPIDFIFTKDEAKDYMSQHKAVQEFYISRLEVGDDIMDALQYTLVVMNGYGHEKQYGSYSPPELPVVKKEKSPLDKINEAISIQSADGNWDANPYMWGMLNGLIAAKSLVDGIDPEFYDAPDMWRDSCDNLQNLISFVPLGILKTESKTCFQRAIERRATVLKMSVEEYLNTYGRGGGKNE